MKIFAYFYFMKQEPEKVQQLAPQHIKHWRTNIFDYYQGGPFADWSGGLITFSRENLEEATKLVDEDPFIKEDLLAQYWLKEWVVELAK